MGIQYQLLYMATFIVEKQLTQTLVFLLMSYCLRE